MLKGRLGLETARVPQKERHGLLWLEHGNLTVENGTLVFTTAGGAGLEAGAYDIPYQMVNVLLLGPGSTLSHDALRLMARHGTGFVAVGSSGVRSYASSMPAGPDQSKRARQQAELWANPEARLSVALAMFERRFGEEVTGYSLPQLRGIEAARVKACYKAAAQRHGIAWTGRRYDRNDPGRTDDMNQAINHAAIALLAAAKTAVAVAGAVPQLGFVHEDSGWAFALDIADLYREEIALEGAFSGLSHYRRHGGELERIVRREAGRRIRKEQIISSMLDAIKELIDDRCGDQ